MSKEALETLKKIANFIGSIARTQQPAYDEPPEPVSQLDADLLCAEHAILDSIESIRTALEQAEKLADALDTIAKWTSCETAKSVAEVNLAEWEGVK